MAEKKEGFEIIKVGIILFAITAVAAFRSNIFVKEFRDFHKQ